MADNTIFVDPEKIKECAGTIDALAGRIEGTFEQIGLKVQSTESLFQAESAETFREQFTQLKPDFENFVSYLRKISSYLTQNVADPTIVTDKAALQNIQNIQKLS